MKTRWHIGIGLVLIVGVLVGCTGDKDDKKPETPTPTPLPTEKPVSTVTPSPEASGTPVAQAAEATATPSVTPTDTATPPPIEPATDTPTEMPMETPVPTVTEAPTLTPPPTTSAPPPTITPWMEVMPSKTPLPTLTPPPGAAAPTSPPVPTATFRVAPPTLTPTPLPLGEVAIASFTPPPSFTPWVNVPPTETPWPSPTVFYGQPPTFTPVIVVQTPISPVPPSGQVCPTCSGLRLRNAPGTAGQIVAELAANTPLAIVGRTGDNVWLQVSLSDSSGGWVAAQYIEYGTGLGNVPITGTAVDVPTPDIPPPPGGTTVISGISAHAREIFLAGQAKGNRANVFSKVGDSITVPPQFLHQLIDVYDLGEYSYLDTALYFFYGPTARGTNPFSTNSVAAGNGWTTADVLDPRLANASLCRSGETPLECEYRITKPSVALIMLGTNDTGGFSVDMYRSNLQRIIDISINMGVIPVLSTIPPMRFEPNRDARVDQFNQVVVALARSNDIPLWNYWLALQNAPNLGLATDGVHPSVPPDNRNAHFDEGHLRYGFPIRNLTALQMLNDLWRYVLYDATPGVYPTEAPPPPGDDTVIVPPVDTGTYSCPGAPPPRLTVGNQGRVTPGVPNKIRSTPGLQAPQIGSIPGEAVFDVLSGPQCVDNYTWWEVYYDGIVGWTASGNGQEYWVEPYP